MDFRSCYLHSVLLVASAFLTSMALGQPLPGTVPVPPANLRGGTFVAPDSSFEVTAPGDHWQWLRFEAAEKAVAKVHPELNSETFLVYQEKPRVAFIFSILAHAGDTAPNDEFMRGMQGGEERTAANAGSEIKDFAFEPADIPVKGASYRFHFVAIRGDGTVKYRFGYIGGISKKYQFSYSDVTSNESAAFRSVVASFRLLAPAR